MMDLNKLLQRKRRKRRRRRLIMILKVSIMILLNWRDSEMKRPIFNNNKSNWNKKDKNKSYWRQSNK